VRRLMFGWVAVVIALMSAPPAQSSVRSEIQDIIGVPVYCDDVIAGTAPITSTYYKPNIADGWFDWIDHYEGDVAIPREQVRIFLDRYTVCRQIANKWNYGWPTAQEGRKRLAVSILVVAHEARHSEQWNLGGSDALSESDATEWSCTKGNFTWWAKQLHVSTYDRRVELRNWLQGVYC